MSAVKKKIYSRNVAVILANDNVLRHINQTTGQIPRICGTKSGVRQTFARTMRRNEVVRNRKTFAEIGRNWQVDNLARRVCHKPAHTRQLAHLLFITACTGVCHHKYWVKGIHIVHHGIGHIIGSFVPKTDNFFVAFILGYKPAIILSLHFADNAFCFVDDCLFGRRHDYVRYSHSHTRYASVVITQIFHCVYYFRRFGCAEVIVAFCNEFADFLLVHQNAQIPLAAFLVLVKISKFRRQKFVKNHAPQRCIYKPVLAIAVNTYPDFCLKFEFMLMIRQQCFAYAGKGFAFALGFWFGYCKIIRPQYHVLRRYDNRFTVLWRKNMVGGKHKYTRLGLGFGGKRQMYRHLIAVEVCIVRSTSQGVKF